MLNSYENPECINCEHAKFIGHNYSFREQKYIGINHYECRLKICKNKKEEKQNELLE
jgi:hypothetical protein